MNGIDPEVCEKCPLNKLEGAAKIFGDIESRPILILTQSPSPEENDKEELLVGPHGKFIWEALRRVGIDRGDCDTTAAVRCIPAEVVKGSYSQFLRPKAPSKKEIEQCRNHTRALVQIAIGKEHTGTRAILILGQIAAKQLLGAEYKKERRIIDSAKLGVRVFCVDHPGFFLRAGKVNEDDDRLKAFRQTIKALADFVGSGSQVMTAEEYLKSQKYVTAHTAQESWDYARKLKKWAIERGERLSVDVEDDVPDDFGETGSESGDQIMLTVAISPKKGYSVMFVVDHPEGNPKDRDERVSALRWLLSDPKVGLVMHYGSTDAEKLKDILDIDTPGYRLDTFTGMYLAFNNGRKSYGLNALADEFAPEFAGYKWIIAPYVGAEIPQHIASDEKALQKWHSTREKLLSKKNNEALYKWMKTKSILHFRDIPLHVLNLYNNADADVGKRFEILVRDEIPEALAGIYTDMNHLTMQMERNGPLVDYQHIEVLKRVWPPLVKNAAQRLKDVAGVEDFNPNTPADIGWLLWTKLQIPYPDPRAKKLSTGKEILLQIAPDYPIAKEVIDYRKLAKTKNTYIDGYEFCANLNAGRLRTKWWLSGTRTGRLSSGGSKEKIAGVVNLQNIQKNQQIRNMLISDLRWRDLHLRLRSFVHRSYMGNDEKGKDALIVEWNKSAQEIQDIILLEFGDLETFLEFDQGQVEVRMAAQISGDRQMIADCEAGDIHSQVGHAMTGWAIEKIKNDKDTRTRTKNVHFGVLFGLNPEGILRYIKGFDPTSTITLDQVQGYYNNYFRRYPGVRVYIEGQHSFAEKHGFVETIFGMKRPLIINEQLRGLFDEYGQPAYWRNISVNTPIQGSAHQLLMCGMVALIRQPDKYGLLGIPQMEVHDNLVMRVKLHDLVECYWLAKEMLEEEPIRTVASEFPHIKWRVKLEVDGAAGFRFGVKVGLNNKLMQSATPIGTFLQQWYIENVNSISAFKALKAKVAT